MKRRDFLIITLSGASVMKMNFSIKEKLETVPIGESFFGKREDTIVTWLGMAGALINSRGTIIFIDPLISYGGTSEICETGNRLLVPLPITADLVPKADYICYTHADSDHFAEKSARILNTRLAPIFISPGPVFESLNNVGIDKNRMIKIKDFASYTFGDVRDYDRLRLFITGRKLIPGNGRIAAVTSLRLRMALSGIRVILRI